MDRITFLQSIPASNQGGRFATDLYLTLQQVSITPKLLSVYILTTIPGHISWKLLVFGYTSFLFFRNPTLLLGRTFHWRYIMKESLIFPKLTFLLLVNMKGTKSPQEVISKRRIETEEFRGRMLSRWIQETSAGLALINTLIYVQILSILSPLPYISRSKGWEWQKDITSTKHESNKTT